MPRQSAASVDRRRTGPATRQALLDAAKRLLSSGASVATLSIDKIVAEAGMGRATFYLHFREKSELVAALAEDQVAWRDEIGAEALADPELDRATLDNILNNIVSRWVENRAVLAAIIEVAEYDPDMRAIWRAAMLEVAEKAATQFEARWNSDPSAPRSPHMVAEVFTWMFERSCHQVLTDPSRQAELTETLAEIIWRVLESRQPPHAA